MAGMAAKIVSQYFESKETKLNELEEDLLKIGWNFQGGSMVVFFKFDDSDTHVHLEGLDFIRVPEDKFDSMYKVLNECNDSYSHVKFVLDTENGQICARDDDVIQLDSCGAECFELMIRMVKVVEDAYPRFMKAMWA
ncbi:MAG: YbjN domain-containing protein [Lachnospiraceae bacterium]|nr:YbjN domain-containing protein [Lachnospiraceae bacterium]